MLRVTYTGGDAPQRWFFDPDEVDMREAERIEQSLGDGSSWDDFVSGLLAARVGVRRVLLWHLLRRSNPDYDMPIDDLPNFKMGQLVVELGSREIGVLLDSTRENTRIPLARRKRIVASLEAEMYAAQVAEAAILAGDVTDDPKGPATSDAGSIPTIADPVPPTASDDSATRT